MSETLEHLARLVGGELRGDGTCRVNQARPLEEADPGSITFVASARELPRLATSRASAVVLPMKLETADRPSIRVSDPLTAILAIAQELEPHASRPMPGTHPTAIIDAGVTIPNDCSIGPYAVIGPGVVLGRRAIIGPHTVIEERCQLGDDVAIHSRVVLYRRTVIGARVIIHSGAVIGADGFGYQQKNGRHEKIPQLGRVLIEDDVEIGANTTIDRGMLGTTRIGAGSKIDNLVQIAHNCQIGRHNILASQTGIAGSCTTGEHVMMAGQVGIADHVQIGDRTIIAAQSGVPNDLPPGSIVMGNPSRPVSVQRRIYACWAKLPEIRRELADLRRRLGFQDEGEQEEEPPRRAAG